MATDPLILSAMLAILAEQGESSEAAKLEADIKNRLITGTA